MSWLKNDRVPLTVSPKEYIKGHSGLWSKNHNHVSVSKGMENSRDTVGHSRTQSRAFNPLRTTCTEEAEALKAAPPWLGAWATKPTLRQRLMAWVRYL